MKCHHHLYWLHICSILGLGIGILGRGRKVRFYEKYYQNGYYEEYTSTPSCQNLPSLLYLGRGSVWTDDCVMAYQDTECQASSIKIESIRVRNLGQGFLWERFYYREDGRKYNYFYSDHRKLIPSSFRFCEPQGEGGERLHVDLLSSDQTVAKSYKNLCACENLPRSLSNHRLDFDNHGNDFAGFEKDNCTGKYVVYPAGKVPILNQEHHSIGPVPYAKSLPSCLNMSASIYKFEFYPPDEEYGGGVERKEYSSKTSFWNNGSARIAVIYELEETVRESVEMEVATAFRDLHKVGVEVGVEVETTAGVPFLGSATFTVGLKTSYEYNREEGRFRKGVKSVSEEKQIRVEQEIQVPPCTNYTAHAYVALAKNKTIRYKAYSKVEGYLGSKRLSSPEIRERIPAGLEVMEDYDEFTVLAVANGTMKAEHDIKSGIHGEGEKIEGCEEYGN